MLDQFGNLVSTDNSDQVSVVSVPGSLTSGSTSRVTVSGGVATFSNLVLTKVGTYTLSANTPGLTSATSASFGVGAASAFDLSFTVQPGNGTAGSAINPAVQVQVQDQFGNLIRTDNSDQVSVAVAKGPGSLTGNSATVKVSGGVAVFSNLVLTTAGTYTLGASATGGLKGTNSTSFTINPSATLTLSPHLLQPGRSAAAMGRRPSAPPVGSGPIPLRWPRAARCRPA